MRLKFLLALVTLANFATPAVAQQAYPLACLRGPNTWLNVQFGGAASYHFRAATAGGATQFGLEPGHCAWMDRALHAGEPTQVWAEGENARFLVRIMQNVRQGDVFVVWAYNDGSFLRVTRFDP